MAKYVWLIITNIFIFILIAVLTYSLINDLNPNNKIMPGLSKDYAAEKNAKDDLSTLGESSGAIDEKTDSSGNDIGPSTAGTDESSNCETVQISYALKNLKAEEECINSQEDICIRKRTKCSLNVYNLDYQISGKFIIKIIYLADNEPIDSYIIEDFVNAREIKPFESNLEIEGEKANKKITCSFNSEEIPEKNIC